NLRPETVDLRAIIERAIQTARHEITAARHDFSSRMPKEPVWIKGDALRLEQIFANLLDNSAKYTNPGGTILLTLDIASHEGEKAGREAIVRIRDNGMGIEPQQLKQLFKFFSREDVSYARRHDGLGIGLSLVKGLVELHGGSVEAQSEGTDKG